MDIDKLKLYLPKYLSSESESELFKQLKDFPNNIDQRIYTPYLKGSPIIYQGDGIKDLLVIQLPQTKVKKVNSVILSNTCDIDQGNKRNFPSKIIYSPLITFSKYRESLTKSSSKNPTQLNAHFDAIRKQQITQIFFLPQIDGKIEDSIIFLDRIQNISNDYVNRDTLSDVRLFTLSDYGIYLFLFKISIHFTRIQDKVDRKSNLK